MDEKHATKTACINGLPEDEHMMFETCRRLDRWEGSRKHNSYLI